MEVEVEKISEYIVKITNIIPRDRCKSLLKSMEKEGDFPDNILEADVEFLSEIVENQLENYLKNHAPPVDLTESDASEFTLQLDTIKIDENGTFNFNYGGKNKSDRFLAFTFVISENMSKNYFEFTAQKTTNNYQLGELYISPPYFTHRFSITINKESNFRAINIFVCV